MTYRRIEPQPATEVYVSGEGLVCIRQGELGNDDTVLFTPEQVPLVIEWLQECLNEVERPPDRRPSAVDVQLRSFDSL